MFSYLKGEAIAIQQNLQGRSFLILEVRDLGYEIQVPGRFAQELTPSIGTVQQIFVHGQQREDGLFLYGFRSGAERDLFRQLISVSGIGSQGAIALLDTLTLPELVQAIVTADHRQLVKAPGVGKKTAERLALELRNKLSQWRSQFTPVDGAPQPSGAVREDLELTLLALGYQETEILQAIATLSQDGLLVQNPNADEWIRQAISLLSQP
ncbi:Holliday junction DNA helicase RuvA [[Synechococcus] sp. NIES-970]|uniref:Holliday junction branch migration protein RuvA n=1 Tax=Picosynechococcus sp. NKBG15041c TaxID=1407650 RepID=UPI0004118177|nr:Holliday junction branch migration protein RuvA [Picosynechococcus sp. NKBG15041c]BAW96464.1 Holliday junction DNA helicase RuvA [[Synechococcus] sp. NIES-970]